MNATRIPTGGPDDLEALLRAELGAVAEAVGADGRPAPASALLVRGRTARRRRRAALTGAAALATAAVLAVGFGVVDPVLRAEPQPAGPTPALPTPATAQAIADWVNALPVGPVPEIPRSREGVVAVGTTSQKLPKVAGRGRIAYGQGVSARGLLIGWPADKDTGPPGIPLGWLAPSGRWTVVDTLALSDARVTPDGTQYVVTGKPLAGPKKDRFVISVRTVADDAVVTTLDLPDGSLIKGWFDGGWLLTRADGTTPSLLRDGRLIPREDLVPTAPTGEPPIAVTSVQGDAVVYTMPSFQGCPAVDGSPSMMTAAHRYDGGVDAGTTMLGCFFLEAEPVSPDGLHTVVGLDELTVRTLGSREPVGPVGPAMPAGSTVVIWEPDGAHVQVEVIVTSSQGEFRRIVRCSAADGRCVRNA
jgi:hypothetical protein